jgi:hypothetical protein
MTRILTRVSAAIEGVTGVALIAVPEVVARLLLGSALSGSGIAVARVAGFALLSLAIACWPDGNGTTVRAMFLYNLPAGIFLGYLRVGGGFIGYLLWPASALHIILGILLARPAYESVSFARPDRPGPH